MEMKKFYGSLVNTIVVAAFALFILCCVGGIGNLFGATGGIFGFTLAFGNAVIVIAASATAWRIGNAAIAITEEKQTEKAKETTTILVEKQETGVDSLPTIPVAANEKQPQKPKTKTPKVQTRTKTQTQEEYVQMPPVQEEIPMPDDMDTVDTGIISSPMDDEYYGYYDDPAFDEIPDGIT